MPSYENDVSIYMTFVTHLEYMNHRLIAFSYISGLREREKGKTERGKRPFKRMRMFEMMKKRERRTFTFYHN